MKSLIVKEKGKLLEYLIQSLFDYKKKEMKQLLKFGAIAVNEKMTTQFDFPLKPGDKIDIQTDKKTVKPNPTKSRLEIIYEDNDLIVINKPAGLLSIATDTVK